MNKQLRNLLVMAVVLVALLVLWMASKWLPDLGKSQETTAATTGAQTALLSVDSADVARIEVHNNLSDLTLLPQRSEDSAGKTQVTWNLAEDQGFPINQSSLSRLADAILSITYTEIIVENPDDLAAFGLNRPSSLVSIILADGSSKSIEFGNSLSSGKGAYARISQDNRVFAVESRFKDQASQSLSDLIDLSQAIGGLTPADVTGLTFFRRDDQLLLECQTKLANPDDVAAGLLFEVAAPITRSGNSDTLSSLLNSILQASAVRLVDLDTSDLQRYGLSEPRYQFKLTSTKQDEVIFSVGDSAGSGQYFVTSSALPAIMTIQADSLKAVDLPLVDYVDRFVALMNIWNVSAVSLDLEGVHHEYTLSVDEGQKLSDEAVELTYNGRDAKIVSQSGASLFSEFYQTLIGIRMDGFDLKASPEGPAQNRITYVLKPDPKSGSRERSLIIEFVTRDAYTDYVLIDGTYTGFFVNHRDAFTSDQIGREGLQIAVKHLQDAIDHAVDGVYDTSKGYPSDS